jgi:hypothetical protein
MQILLLPPRVLDRVDGYGLTPVYVVRWWRALPLAMPIKALRFGLLLEVLTEAVDHVTVGLVVRWSGRGKEGVASVDRLGRTVVAHRAVAAAAGPEAGGGPATHSGPEGAVRDPVCPAHRHPVGVSAAGVGLRVGDDLLAAAGRMERGGRVGPVAPGAAEEAAGREEARLVAGGDRLLPCAGGSARPKSGPSPVDRARPGSKHHVLTDGQGIPLAVSLTGGNRNDVTQLLPLLDKVPPVAGVAGRPRRLPDALLVDRGYDHDKYRRLTSVASASRLFQTSSSTAPRGSVRRATFSMKSGRTSTGIRIREAWHPLRAVIYWAVQARRGPWPRHLPADRRPGGP